MLISPNKNQADDSGTNVVPIVAPPAQGGMPAIPEGDAVAEMLLHCFRRTPLLLVPAAPGAGKTHRSVIAAAHLAAYGKMKVLVTANTNGQAREFADRLASTATDIDVTLLASKASIDEHKEKSHERVNVRSSLKEIPKGHVVVSTAAKACYFKKEMKADIMLIDEAWQVTYTTFLKLSVFADTFMLVGDPGQIDPIVTVDVDQWRSSQIAPHLPAPVVLANSRPDACHTITLDTTRRLGAETANLIAPLYPFGLSSLRLPTEITDADGTNGQPEIVRYVSPDSGGVSDPAIAATIAAIVDDSLTSCVKDSHGIRPISPADIAVCVPHNSQVSAIKSRVPKGVLVSTANSLQGLECPIVVVWDPLAGHAGCPDFNLNTGRLCVALSRHRTQLRWVTTESVDIELAKALEADPENAELDVNVEIRTTLNAAPAGNVIA